MQLVHTAPKTKGRLIFTHLEHAPKYFSKTACHEETIVTIALNSSEPQKIFIDGIWKDCPAFSIISLVSTQDYRFEKPYCITAWQYTNGFYGTADYYSEINCLGPVIFGFTGTTFLPVSEIIMEKLTELKELFIEEFHTTDNNQTEMLHLLLKRLLILTTRVAKEHYQEEKLFEEERFNLMRQFSILVNQHFKSEHQVQFYAQQLHKTPKNLARIFNGFNCSSLSTVIQNRLATEAKDFLSGTSLSVKEIAFELGFKDASHFSRFFKKATHLKPSDFRKQ